MHLSSIFRIEEMCTTNDRNDDVLCGLVRHFYSGSLNFSSLPELKLSWDLQKKFLDMTVLSSRLQKYPVNKNFSRLFFKKLIGLLQNENVHDDLYNFLCSVMSDNTEYNFCYRHYIIDNDLTNIVTIKETNNMVVNGTTGLKTWEASLILTDWILCNKGEFDHKKVLELGSGVGLTGISIAKFCNVEYIYLTDCHHQVLETICDNVMINFPHINKCEQSNGVMFSDGNKSIGVSLFDWNYTHDLTDVVSPDVVIGADIIYDPCIIKPLCNVLEMLFERNCNLIVFIQSVIRNEETFKMFTQLLGKDYFCYEEIQQEKPVYVSWNYETKKRLLKITKRCTT